MLVNKIDIADFEKQEKLAADHFLLHE